MASGSYFLILMETNNVLSPEDLLMYNKNKAGFIDMFIAAPEETPETVLQKKLNRLQDTQTLKIETPEDLEECYDYYSVRTGKQYKLLLKINFLSGFNCLKEHYCMNPYFSSGEHEFTIFEIYKMLEALIYIQNKDFWNASLETTLLSHNDFISVFEELSNAFIDRFRPIDPDNYYEDYEDEKYCIKKLIDLCNAYLTISKYTEAKTKIVYKSY